MRSTKPRPIAASPASMLDFAKGLDSTSRGIEFHNIGA